MRLSQSPSSGAPFVLPPVKRVEILVVGRLKERGLRALCDDYYRRCKQSIEVHEREVSSIEDVARDLERGRRAFVVALDERGEQLTSRDFAARLASWRARADASRLVFLVGGADGLGDALRARADATISLSTMTLAHRVARVVFAEQLYSAESIQQGAPYHRD